MPFETRAAQETKEPASFWETISAKVGAPGTIDSGENTWKSPLVAAIGVGGFVLLTGVATNMARQAMHPPSLVGQALDEKQLSVCAHMTYTRKQCPKLIEHFVVLRGILTGIDARAQVLAGDLESAVEKYFRKTTKISPNAQQSLVERMKMARSLKRRFDEAMSQLDRIQCIERSLEDAMGDHLDWQGAERYMDAVIDQQHSIRDLLEKVHASLTRGLGA